MRQDSALFVQRDGIHVRRTGVSHRNEEYDEHGFDMLFRMQRDHFWYRGRHRFLLAALEDQLSSFSFSPDTRSAIDLGGGCGGWIDYLLNHSSLRFRELALADSSFKALDLAAAVIDSQVPRFQLDLLDLGWNNRWDIVFLLDVLALIPDDVFALQQIREGLTQNGLLFLTLPALNAFWSYNDELIHHQRRYSRKALEGLAEESGLKLIKARYFMFFLSPLMYLSRLCTPKIQSASPEEIRTHLEHTHKVPVKPLNVLLQGIFSMETPLGLWLSFPWGTSILGIFQK
jgi:SAM-dependent methyltransferase